MPAAQAQPAKPTQAAVCVCAGVVGQWTGKQTCFFRASSEKIKRVENLSDCAS